MNTPAAQIQATKTDVRRVVMTLTIASFTIAALMGIAALLGASILSETSLKVLATTVVVGCASVVTLCCLVVVGGRFQAVGVLGFVVTLGAALLALVMVWSASETMWETWGDTFRVALTASLTLAQICLLLGLAGARRGLSGLMWPTVGLALVVGAMVSALIYGTEPGEGYVRAMGIVAILDVLGTLVTIALGVFGRDQQSLTVSVPPELARRVRAEAQTTGRPVSAVVEQALAQTFGAPVD